MFRVGQKVCCISAAPESGKMWRYGDDVPVLGAVYTIAAIYEDMVALVELKRSSQAVEDLGFDGYGAWRFRPLVERKTDISFAHEILRKASQKERA